MNKPTHTSEKCHICGDDPVFMQFCSAPHTQRTSNWLSEADQREAAWSNFCRETPVHLRGPWEAFVWAWEARKHSIETPDDLGEQIYALLVRRGYAQHEAHLIASGPGCISDCVQKGYPEIDCPAHGANTLKANSCAYCEAGMQKVKEDLHYDATNNSSHPCTMSE